MESDNIHSAWHDSSYINAAPLRWAEAQKQVRPALARTLFLFLAQKSDKYGCSWYAQRTLSEETQLSERGIRKYLTALAAGRTDPDHPPLERGAALDQCVSPDRLAGA